MIHKDLQVLTRNGFAGIYESLQDLEMDLQGLVEIFKTLEMALWGFAAFMRIWGNLQDSQRFVGIHGIHEYSLGSVRIYKDWQGFPGIHNTLEMDLWGFMKLCKWIDRDLWDFGNRFVIYGFMGIHKTLEMDWWGFHDMFSGIIFTTKIIFNQVVFQSFFWSQFCSDKKLRIYVFFKHFFFREHFFSQNFFQGKSFSQRIFFQRIFSPKKMF